MTVTLSDLWDSLYRLDGYYHNYPGEDVIRFMQSFPRTPGDHAVDVGCGAGRHTAFLTQLGYHVDAVDVSAEAIRVIRERVGGYNAQVNIHHASMTELPLPTGQYAVALCIGTIYYATRGETIQAIGEIHRILKPGGHAFVTALTTDDWRRAVTDADGVVDAPDEVEYGLPHNFVTGYELETMYGAFTEVGYELSETTHRGRTITDSRWLINLTK